MDAVFADEETYEHVKNSDVLNLKSMAKVYNVDPSRVITCRFYDPALAFKFTIPRPQVQS